MCLVAGDLLHDVEVIDGREEVPKREHRDGLFRRRGCRESQFVNFRTMSAFYQLRESLLGRRWSH